MTLVLLIPLLGTIALLLTPKRFAWYMAIVIAAAGFIQTLTLTTATLPLTVRHNWIPAIGAQYLLTLDGISLLLIGLTSLMSMLGILASPGQPRLFYSMLLLLEAACLGVFLAQDLLLFFICFEAVLIPMYFLIGIYGAEKRRQAAFKFLIYTIVGSIAILLGFLTLYLQHVLFHSVPLLLRLHAVHHADPDFDLTTGIRFHPLEILISALIKLAAVAALGAPVLAVLVFELLLNATAMFNHANVSLPGWLEPWIRRLLVTPDMHRVHHSVIEAERNSNYGFCLSVWDRLLGTYTLAPRGQLDIGLAAWRDQRTIATLHGTLGMPFRQTG